MDSSGTFRRPGDRAVIAQTEIADFVDAVDSTYCLEFWLGLFGSGLGPLRVYLQPENATNLIDRDFLSWHLEKPVSRPRDTWHQARVSLPRSLGGRRVVFEAQVGEVGRGDVGLDSVSLTEGPCPIHPESAAVKKNSHDCTFEFGMCYWEAAGAKVPLESAQLEGLIDEEEKTSEPFDDSKWRYLRRAVWRPKLSEAASSKAEKKSSSSSKEMLGTSLWSRVRGGHVGVPKGHTK